MITTTMKIKAFFRPVKWALQKVFRKDHVSDNELFSLDYTIAKFVLPRLRYYVEDPVACPCIDGDWSFEKWRAILEKMVFFFEYAVGMGEGTDMEQVEVFQKEQGIDDFDKAEKVFYEKVDEGKRLFCEYYFDLWT